jgi:hypothetical protein
VEVLAQKARREFNLLDKTQILLSPIRQPKFEVKIEFSQRVLNLIGRSAHSEHLINDHRALDFK